MTRRLCALSLVVLTVAGSTTASAQLSLPLQVLGAWPPTVIVLHGGPGVRHLRPERDAPALLDTTLVLGRVERDLTGDGQPETLTVTATGPSLDSLATVVFTITSASTVLHTHHLASLTRTVGYDGGRQRVSPQEYRERLRSFGAEFFADGRFQTPAAFLEVLRNSLPGHAARIATVMARSRAPYDTADTALLWEEMQRAPITIFTFSPGGDEIVTLGWSSRTGRFYRLLECC